MAFRKLRSRISKRFYKNRRRGGNSFFGGSASNGARHYLRRKRYQHKAVKGIKLLSFPVIAGAVALWYFVIRKK